jgi:hypothetical protein
LEPNRGSTRRLRMISIRKFVGYAKVVGGIGAVLMLAVS